MKRFENLRAKLLIEAQESEAGYTNFNLLVKYFKKLLETYKTNYNAYVTYRTDRYIRSCLFNISSDIVIMSKLSNGNFDDVIEFRDTDGTPKKIIDREHFSRFYIADNVLYINDDINFHLNPPIQIRLVELLDLPKLSKFDTSSLDMDELIDPETIKPQYILKNYLKKIKSLNILLAAIRIYRSNLFIDLYKNNDLIQGGRLVYNNDITLADLDNLENITDNKDNIFNLNQLELYFNGEFEVSFSGYKTLNPNLMFNLD